MARYRRLKRTKRLDQLASKLARESNPSKLESFLVRALRQFGGLDAFMRQWKEHYDAATREAPGRRRVVAMLTATMRIMEAQMTAKPAKPDLDLLSDEDLQREEERVLIGLIAKQPALAIAAVTKLGWTVVPPN